MYSVEGQSSVVSLIKIEWWYSQVSREVGEHKIVSANSELSKFHRKLPTNRVECRRL